jgi:transposase
MVAADARTAVTFSLSPGQAGDAPEGRQLLKTLENSGWDGTQVIMDKAYEGDETRQLVFDLGMVPVVPPKSNRVTVWEYDKEMYKKRNEVERLFRRLKGFRRIFSRFDKLDVVFKFFIHFALITDALISVNRP